MGNGASIAIDKCFTYRSLYEEAHAAGLFSGSVGVLFDSYATQDFEFILRLLWTAHQVNLAFDVDDVAIVNAYGEVKSALIHTVQRVHVSHANALPYMDRIADFLGYFPRIMSLNYDLLVYWAMMHGNTRAGGQWFKDGFIHEDRTFHEDYRFLLKPHGGMKGASLVFYPHGNLALGTGRYEEIAKIVSEEKTDLLETIVKRWTLDNCTPLFVSEGTESQKMRAIQRHAYLHFVYNNILGKLRWEGSFTIYGWSMADQDQHLLDALGKNKPVHVAVSVFRGAADWEKYCEDVEKKFRKTYGLRDTRILFFDSSDEGAWIH